jgi:hypothetical protein
MPPQAFRNLASLTLSTPLALRTLQAKERSRAKTPAISGLKHVDWRSDQCNISANRCALRSRLWRRHPNAEPLSALTAHTTATYDGPYTPHMAEPSAASSMSQRISSVQVQRCHLQPAGRFLIPLFGTQWRRVPRRRAPHPRGSGCSKRWRYPACGIPNTGSS